MEKIITKVNGKINLTLDIVGVKDNFHQLESLVSTIDIFDEITLTKRADKKITLAQRGIVTPCPTDKNNAYKAAELFMKTFDTHGVDIVINKNIPLASGLGGSSADIVGVVKGMKALYHIDGDMTDILNAMGSDTLYMYNGGLAVIKGRGELIEKVDADIDNLYLIIVTADKTVSAKDSYAEFDRLNKTCPECTLTCLNALKNGNMAEFYETMKNDLYEPSSRLCVEIKDNYNLLKSLGINAIMTGSGSAVTGVFDSEKERDVAFNKLKDSYNLSMIKAKTIF